MGIRIFCRRSSSRGEVSRLRPGFPGGSIHGRGLSLASGQNQTKIEGRWPPFGAEGCCGGDNIGKKDCTPWNISINAPLYFVKWKKAAISHLKRHLDEC